LKTYASKHKEDAFFYTGKDAGGSVRGAADAIAQKHRASTMYMRFLDQKVSMKNANADFFKVTSQAMAETAYGHAYWVTPPANGDPSAPFTGANSYFAGIEYPALQQNKNVHCVYRVVTSSHGSVSSVWLLLDKIGDCGSASAIAVSSLVAL
jgi:hypothetical protein